MAVICIGPICIPLWPLIAITIKPIWDRLVPPRVKEKLNLFWSWFISWICPARSKKANPRAFAAVSDDMIICDVRDKYHFEELRASANTPVIFKFTAEWCGPCHQIEPQVLKLASKYQGRVVFAELDIDKLDELALELGVASIPAFHGYAGGRMVQSFSGANYQKLEELVASVIKASSVNGKDVPKKSK